MKRAIILLGLLFSLCASFDIVANEAACKVGQKFITSKDDRFVRECFAVENGDTYYNVIGCRSQDDKFFALGTTYDYEQIPGFGFRFKCQKEENSIKYGTEACLMGTPMKVVKKGERGVIYNKACACKENGIDCS